MTTAVSVAAAIDTLNGNTQQSPTAKHNIETADMPNGLTAQTRETQLDPSKSSDKNETSRIVLNPLLSEFIDCIENLPGRLQLLLTELRNVDAEVNLRHGKLQSIKQQILSNTMTAARTSLAKSDGCGSSASSSYSDVNADTPTTSGSNNPDQSDSVKITIKQLLNSLHQILLQCQLLGDQKVKITGQIMEILSNKTRRLGLDTKSHEERNFQVELDEEKIVNEFKVAIKKRTMHAKKNHLTNGANACTSGSSRVSQRHQNTSIHLQSGSTKTKQQHLNSAEINKVVAKYTKPSTTNSSTNVISRFLSFSASSRQPIDAYSFENDDQQMSSNLNNRLKGSKDQTSDTDTKSLRSLNNLMNDTCTSKKTDLRTKYVDMKLNSNVNNKKSSTKKLRDLSVQYVASPPRSKNAKSNDTSPQSLNNRPKRHLNYANANIHSKPDSMSAVSLNKKRRLDQLKSNTLNMSANISNENSINQCMNSPSSSSTSSLNTSKLKRHTKGITNKITEGKLQTTQLTKNVKKNKKTTTTKMASSGYMDRRQSSNNKRSIENQDDADDDLSNDEMDEYAGNHFDSDHENEGNREQFSSNNNKLNKHSVHKTTSDNEDMNSNETESINELDELNNSEDEATNVNGSNVSDLDEESDEGGYGTKKKLKVGYIAKNYESLNEENSENDNKNFNSKSSKVKTPRIKPPNNIYQQPQQKTKATSRMQMDFPIDPSEPIYCLCSEISYGNMIGCDNDRCEIEWFHFECVKLSSKPKGKWYCPHCRGDNHKVMKKFTNHNTSTTGLKHQLHL